MVAAATGGLSDTACGRGRLSPPFLAGAEPRITACRARIPHVIFGCADQYSVPPLRETEQSRRRPPYARSLTFGTVSQSHFIQRVTVVGAGLVGTSIALRLRRHGIDVRLCDPDAGAILQAQRKGAGTQLTPDDLPADVVVIASPPSTVAKVLLDAVARGLGSVYTDVASTKSRIASDVVLAEPELDSYVPGHPVVGADLALSVAADPDLFAGRPWHLCPLPRTSRRAIDSVISVIELCDGRYRLLAPDVHDRHMAAVSHAPRLIAAAVAARFADADENTLPVRGSRFHDTLSVATAAPALWSDTVEQNANHVADELDLITSELTRVAKGLRNRGGASVPEPARLFGQGKRGHNRVVEHFRRTSSRGDGVPGPEEEWFWTW